LCEYLFIPFSINERLAGRFLFACLEQFFDLPDLTDEFCRVFPSYKHVTHLNVTPFIDHLKE